MADPAPSFAQRAYAILYNRFLNRPFGPQHLSWFLSEGMVKKTLHVLEKAGWIRRVSKGSYICINPEDVFRDMVQLKVPRLLREAKKRYAYTRASAVEVWTDYTYIQRSWEHSPYFVKVLKDDLEFWVRYFRRYKIEVFVEDAGPAIGEFVVLFPQDRLENSVYNGEPVEDLKDVSRFCEENIEAFEYPLAYLKSKFGIETTRKIDQRILDEAAKVV